MLQGGFNLRKWNSNSMGLLKLIQQHEHNPVPISNSDNEEELKKSSNLECDGNNICKLLGVDWNNLRDEFTYELSELLQYVHSLPKTKRSILKLTASLFDPLGLLSPFMITLKVIFQDLCINRVNWDEPLSDELKGRWEIIVKELESLAELRVPRCCLLIDQHPISVCLHGFCDASERAYAAVLYLSSTYADGHTEVRLLCSKTRVSPTKRQTIPRLELLGAVILARLVQSVTSSLPLLNGTYLWTDSMTVLHWICNRKVWKQYVLHRVEEIRRLTNPCNWNHCPGTQNPADLPSRGLSAGELLRNNLWWNGPSFISHAVVNPPDLLEDFIDEAQAELSKNPSAFTQVLTSQENTKGQYRICLSELIDCSQYSNMERLLRVTAYILRFINQLRGDKNSALCVDAREIIDAETRWIRSIQYRSFDHELQYLLKPSGTRPLLIDQFGLFIDDRKTLRCHGRINNTQLPLSGKQPALLPPNHHFVTLLIRGAHESVKHGGVNQTLTFLRERFWILKGRQATRKVIRSCVICRRLEGPSYGSVPPPNLPSERVSEDPPFSHTGVDFAGPLYINDANEQSEDKQDKVYVCLFTCAATRAVHLELTRDIGVETFLLALRRFASRRGLPSTLISDNAKTFRSSSKQITKIVCSPEVHKFLTGNRISWKFIVERAPWWGGFWERLVRSVKRCLRKSLGRTILNFDQLNTLLIEIECVLNSRPLTYVEDDTGGIGYTLSPSHLIYGRRITSNPNCSHFEVISTNEVLTKRARTQRHLLQQFTNQWRKEYLLSLRESHKTNSRAKGGSSVSVGDVVVLKEDTKRMFWRLAVVEELLSGPDGQVRAATVRVGKSGRQKQLFRRSVKHLYPLEVSANKTGNKVTEIVTDRRRREAAVAGELRRRLVN